MASGWENRTDTVTITTPKSTPRPNAWQSFLRILLRWESEKIVPWIALRNAIGISLPLAASAALGSPAAGLIASTGALNVSFSDGSDPYAQRAGRMVLASCLGAFAVMVGTTVGNQPNLTILLLTGWAFAAGLLVALDAAAADIGLISLVTFVVFSSQPMSPDRAIASGLLALMGGLLQTSLAIAWWPVRRFDPEQRVLADLFAELANMAASPIPASEAPPLSTQITQAQTTLSRLGRVKSLQAERYLSLLNQAERVRLGILVLTRLRARLLRESGTESAVERITAAFTSLSEGLASVARELSPGVSPKIDHERAGELERIGNDLRHQAKCEPRETVAAMITDARHQISALAGQVRAAMGLAENSTPAGRASFEVLEARQPWRLRLWGTFATLRANLTLRSTACRHAIRLAACVAVGALLARLVGSERAYWLTMTVAIILKPDFTTTFSRGVLRLAGTAAGLVLATAIFHALPASLVTEVVLVALLSFGLRCFGPANYGVFVVMISALVVVLLAITGVAPRAVVADRGVSTAVGGLVALLAYAVWPTWERSQVSEIMARLLDAYREYFRVIKMGYLQPEEDHRADLDRARLQARLARSNFEASAERLSNEPGTPPAALAKLNGMLASTHRLAHALMALEAGLLRSRPVSARAAFRAFADHVEITMHSLAQALRGSSFSAGSLPDLRDLHHALVNSGDPGVERYALVNVETDRVTNSVNTLAGQVIDWIAATTD